MLCVVWILMHQMPFVVLSFYGTGVTVTDVLLSEEPHTSLGTPLKGLYMMIVFSSVGEPTVTCTVKLVLTFKLVHA